MTNSFDRVRNNISSNRHFASLSNSVYAVHSLGLGHGIPMRLDQVDKVGCGEINAKRGKIVSSTP